MSGLIRQADGVAILELPAGPEGYLTGEMCRDALRALDDLAGRLERRETDAGGLVLRGAGQEFCRGFDPVAEEGYAVREALAALCSGIEAFPCPTVACLDGLVSGAGVALALAAHGRVATREARLICPEVGFGLIPGGGSTQRLPRLVGADTALRMMLEGRLHRAGDPALAAVIDGIEDEDPLAQAIKLAKSLAPARKTSLRWAAPARGLFRSNCRTSRPVPCTCDGSRSGGHSRGGGGGALAVRAGCRARGCTGAGFGPGRRGACRPIPGAAGAFCTRLGEG